MKKLVYIAFIFISSFSNAQNTGFEEYVRLGFNGSQVSGDGLEGFNKAGLFGGLGVRRNFYNHLNYDISINYSQKGSRMPIDTLTRQIYLLRLHYVEIPVVVHWEFVEKIDLNIGLAYSRLIAFTERDANGDLPISNPFEKNEISLLFGVNYFLTEKLGVTFNIVNSLKPIRKNPGGGVAPAGLIWRQNDGQYNTVLSLSALLLL